MYQKGSTKQIISAETAERMCQLDQVPRPRGTWNWRNKYGFLIEENSRSEAEDFGLTCAVPKCNGPGHFVINAGKTELVLCLECLRSLCALISYRLWGIDEET